MTPAIKESQDIYLQHYREREQELPQPSPAWLDALRREAIQAFAELGFPNTHQEEWKYTSLAPIAGTSFRPAPQSSDGTLARELQKSSSFDLACDRLVFVNGHYAPGLSSLAGLSKGIKATSLAEALVSFPALLEEHLGRYADAKNHTFVALNTAFIEDGAFVEIPKGVVLEKPLHLLYVSTPGRQPWVSHPRNLLLVGQGSQAMVLEEYLGLGKEAYFTNAVTELVLKENAVFDYVKLQQESATAFHIATVRTHQTRNSSLKTTSLALGSLLVR
jgi:Fe-S cluster assembly protein SufD